MRGAGRSLSSNGAYDSSRVGDGRGHVGFRRANLDDARDIVPFLRRRDLLNLSQAGDPVSIITEALMRSVTPIVGTIDGQIIVMWGIHHVQLLDNRVYVWMLGTTFIDEHKVLFLRYSRDIMQVLREKYSMIYGDIEADFYHSVKWLTWLGARVFKNEDRLMFVIGG